MPEAKIPKDYDERVYAGLLGMCAGVRFGAPIEGWSHAQIEEHLGELDGFFPIPPGTFFKPDDDTAVPLIFIRALEDYGTDLKPVQMGHTWLNYLGDGHGTIWWGGYGRSSEHTAYDNLAHGIQAPLSGSVELNGKILSEQIGGQIFSDIWGLVIPSRPELAAEYAERASSVSHDGEGIYGGRFIAAMVSAAFEAKGPLELIEAGLSVIPADSEYTRVVKAVVDFHRTHSEDWREGFHYIEENFGYDRYPGVVHIIPNAAIIIMALIYGKGDFSGTLQIGNMAGWDTDCNVGNLGTMMGVLLGLDAIEAKWREPMNDILVASGLIGCRNLLDIPGCADLICRLGRKLAKVAPHPARPRYHFEYPGSTQGFQLRASGVGDCILRPGDHEGRGVLKIILNKFGKSSDVRVFTRTFLYPEELSANAYEASFTPKIYPGYILRSRVCLPPDTPGSIEVALYVRDANRGRMHHNPTETLHPGESKELSYTIPYIEGACLSEAGVVLRKTGSPIRRGIFILSSLDWEAHPAYSIEFSKERNQLGCISQWTYLRGYWRLEEGAYHGSGTGINESYTGDIDWTDYTLSVRLVPLHGEHHNINVRVQGALRSYAAGLAPDQKVCLYKNDHGYRQLVSTDFPWSHGRSYTLSLKAKGNRLQLAVEGMSVLDWVDEERPYLSVQIGLSNFQACHTRYEHVEVR